MEFAALETKDAGFIGVVFFFMTLNTDVFVAVETIGCEILLEYEFPNVAKKALIEEYLSSFQCFTLLVEVVLNLKELSLLLNLGELLIKTLHDLIKIEFDQIQLLFEIFMESILKLFPFNGVTPHFQ